MEYMECKRTKFMKKWGRGEGKDEAERPWGLPNEEEELLVSKIL